MLYPDTKIENKLLSGISLIVIYSLITWLNVFITWLNSKSLVLGAISNPWLNSKHG